MKKILMYVFVLTLITFIIPIFFTKVTKEVKSMNVNEAVEIVNDTTEIVNGTDVKIYEYKQYGTIKLLHTKTGEIEDVDIDEYLYGVVSAEMPVDFEMEALKAQAVVARTYTIYKCMQNEGKHGEAHICDSSTCCQAWISKEDRLNRWDEDKREVNWNKIVSAVEETKGDIITYENQPINAFFHSNSGGATEPPINVWGGSGYPYLQTVETSGEDGYEQYNSENEFTKDEFIMKMKEKYSDFEIDFNAENCIQILEYTTGNRIKTIKIGNHNLSGVEVRQIFGLKSANFIIDVSDSIRFKVIGYGHGVGMSQTGADSLAKQGYKYEDIIKHFYTGVEIKGW